MVVGQRQRIIEETDASGSADKPNDGGGDEGADFDDDGPIVKLPSAEAMSKFEDYSKCLFLSSFPLTSPTKGVCLGVDEIVFCIASNPVRDGRESECGDAQPAPEAHIPSRQILPRG